MHPLPSIISDYFLTKGQKEKSVVNMKRLELSKNNVICNGKINLQIMIKNIFKNKTKHKLYGFLVSGGKDHARNISKHTIFTEQIFLLDFEFFASEPAHCDLIRNFASTEKSFSSLG